MADREVVVVTGASAGVGRAVARRFAQEGAAVGLLARGDAGLEGARRDVEAAGGEALVLPTDVSDYEAVSRAGRMVEEILGPIDVWVNDAMASVFSPFLSMHPDEFRRVTEVTYLGYVHGTRVALEKMVPRDRGVVVQVGSALAYRGIPLQTAYCGAKHAIQGFTEAVRSELYHMGSSVRIGMVQLPAVNTPQFDWVLSRLPRRAQPVPPIYQPELPAEAVWHMAHHPRREIWVGWSTIRALLANKVIPGVLDHYLGRKGFASQQTDQPADPNRPSNLWEPVDSTEDHGAHGRFDQHATDHSTALWMSLHKRELVGAAAAVPVAAGAVAMRRRRNGG